MPPPTAADAWLKARRFGIVIDAGSSGSRLQIYSWRDPRVVRQELGEKARYSLPKVEKGTQNDEDWVTKAEPGLSSFADDLDGIPTYLAPLLEHARTHIPPTLQQETPLFLLATAGMRLLTPERQADVLEATCRFLRFHSHFRIDGPSEAGPCGRSVRIITGEEEGLFGWIAVNYLMDGFGQVDDDRATYGFLDMGGASTQIAFEPSLQEREKAKNLIDVRLRMMGGGEVHHQVFVTTWLGYGTNQARERYVGRVIHQLEDPRPPPADSPSDGELLEDPCLPKNLRITETPVHTEPSSSHTKKPHTLIGTGSFDECLKQTAPLLNTAAPCPDTPCLFNGVYVPPIDFSVSRFIGVSEYWYSSEHIFGLGGAYDFVQYERAAEAYCGNEWDSILQMHRDAKQHGQLGGDGQVEADGKLVGLDKWGDQVEISRLQMQCFKAAWIVNVLHEGLGMPRIVDPGGNSTTTNGDDVKHQADRKGLGQPTFQSMDTVGDIAITWTLGKMVLEASNDVPPLSKNTPPLGDPLEEVDSPPFHPIHPPFHIDFDSIEDQLSPHLPSSLTRDSLGFSFIGFLFYLAACTIILFASYRMRHHIRICIRRLTRPSFKRNADYDAVSMEEGWISRPSTPLTPSAPSTRRWMRNLRRFASFWRTRSPPRPPHPLYAPIINRVPASPQRNSPVRSFTFPTSLHPGDASANGSGGSLSAATSPTQSTSGDDPHEAIEASSMSLYSRSRNSSTISLSTLVPRQPLSRSSSHLHLHAP